MSLFHWLLLAALFVSGSAAFYDWRERRIPNWLTVGAIVFALGLRASVGLVRYGSGGALQLLLVGAVGIVVCSILPLLMARFGGMGGGDVKLLAALGAFCGPGVGIQIMYYAFGALLFYATARLAYQGKLFQTLGNSLRLLVRPFVKSERARPVPADLLTQLCFAPAAFAGVCLALLVHSVTL